MKLLSRKELLAKQPLQVVKVELDNDEFVYVRQMTGRERDRFELTLNKDVKDDKGNLVDVVQDYEDFRAKLAVQTICNEDGELILQPEDYPILSQHMGIQQLDKIVKAAQKLNKISQADKEALTKNSGGGQAADSSSDSAKS